MQIPKEYRYRNEQYRRLVASLPCILCGIEGHSQAAHPNAGKAMGMKASDLLCFPLCSVSGNGCHEAWDQYRHRTRQEQAEMEPELGRITRDAVRLIDIPGGVRRMLDAFPEPARVSGAR